MLGLHDSVKKTWKGYVEGKARKENQEEEEDVDLTPHKHERALKGVLSYLAYLKQILTDTLIKPNHRSRR